MRKTLEIEIECGELWDIKVCTYFGTKPYQCRFLSYGKHNCSCKLFKEKLLVSSGLVVRCEQCLGSEKRKEELV
jgi:hypothetical protein